MATSFGWIGKGSGVADGTGWWSCLAWHLDGCYRLACGIYCVGWLLFGLGREHWAGIFLNSLGGIWFSAFGSYCYFKRLGGIKVAGVWRRISLCMGCGDDGVCGISSNDARYPPLGMMLYRHVALPYKLCRGGDSKVCRCG